MEIRQARPQEYETTGRLTQSAYHEFSRPGDPVWLSNFASLGDAAARARHARVLVAVEEGRILGTATLELDRAIDGERLPPDQANLRMLAVAPEVRGRGVGRRLVAACIAGARAAGKQLVTLHTTEEMVAATRLYRSFGFERDLARDLSVGETVRLIAYRLPLPASTPPRGQRGMDELCPDDLRRAVTTAAGTLMPYAHADWSARAGELEWSCRRTLDHTIDCLLLYASNLAMLTARPRGHVRESDPHGSTERLLEALVSSGHILARVAEATPPAGRGYHVLGMADATGFVAMGCDETLVHAGDICAGMGVRFDPPGDLCARVVARLFPWAPAHDDPWERLLWCNGRIPLPGHERLGPEWGWWCAPLEEWDGVAYTDAMPSN